MIGDRRHRIGGTPPRQRRISTLERRLGVGLSLVAFGFLSGYVVGLVTGEDEYLPIDVAIAPAAGPTSSTDQAPNMAQETPTQPISPASYRVSLAVPLLVPSERPPAPGQADVNRRDSAAGEPTLADVPRPDMPATGPMVAIVIDDLGLLEAATESAIALHPAFTLAFLPYGEKAAELAQKAHQAGHEVLLHMPMEPDGPVDPGPGALITGLAPEEIRERISLALDRVPSAMGLNNHMGSRFTADAEAMAVVLDEINLRGMMVLDSVTTPNSVVSELAKAIGVPSESRDVFLDNDRDPALIHQQLDELERIAQVTGQAIALGHPYRETIAVLEEWLPAARKRGIRLVPLSRLAQPRLHHPMIAAQLPDGEEDSP